VGGGTSGTWIWKNVTYTTFAAYQAASGNDAHGLAGVDPLMDCANLCRLPEFGWL
jgi:hypothetical protein